MLNASVFTEFLLQLVIVVLARLEVSAFAEMGGNWMVVAFLYCSYVHGL